MIISTIVVRSPNSRYTITETLEISTEIDVEEGAGFGGEIQF